MTALIPGGHLIFSEKNDSPDGQTSIEVEAQIAVASGDWKQAQKAYEQLLERMAEVFPADAPLLAQGRSALGEILWRQGNRTEGARLILHSQAILQRQLPAESYKSPLLQARAALVSH